MKSYLRDYIEAIIIAIFIALVLRFFVISTYKITTHSMSPTLKVGDFIMTNKMVYGLMGLWSEKKFFAKMPKRGELVVFRCEREEEGYCVKRVIGLPGDRLFMLKNRLVLNGQMAQYSEEKDHILEDIELPISMKAVYEQVAGQSYLILVTEEPGLQNTPPFIVPPDHFYVLADNRDKGKDSRHWGPIHKNQLESRVLLIWLSLGWETEDKTAFPKLRWKRMLRQAQ